MPRCFCPPATTRSWAALSYPTDTRVFGLCGSVLSVRSSLGFFLFWYFFFFCHVLIFIMRPEHFCASRPRRAVVVDVVVVASSGMRLLINCCCGCCWSFASKTLNFINTYMRDMATSGPATTTTATATFVFLGHTKTIMKFIFSLYLFWFFLYSFPPSSLLPSVCF